MDEEQFRKLVELYDRFANALDFDSADARSAEGDFYSLLLELYESESKSSGSLDYNEFKRAAILRCKRRIISGG